MDWIAKYWLEAVFGAVCAALGVAYKRLAKRVRTQREESRAIKDGLLAMLRDQGEEETFRSAKTLSSHASFTVPTSRSHCAITTTHFATPVSAAVTDRETGLIPGPISSQGFIQWSASVRRNPAPSMRQSIFTVPFRDAGKFHTIP